MYIKQKTNRGLLMERSTCETKDRQRLMDKSTYYKTKDK